MSYDRNAELPKALRENLRAHVQNIYRATFNNAWRNVQRGTIGRRSATASPG
jgi:cation transport regulator ChaB